MNYLLDTNVISELMSKQPNGNVVQWIDHLEPEQTYLSVVTVGEIRKGIAKLSESKRKQALEQWLVEGLLLQFDDHILPFGIDEMLTWGTLTGELTANGINLPAMDSLIAATALHHHCTLATRNEADFRHTGVKVFNPWRPG